MGDYYLFPGNARIKHNARVGRSFRAAHPYTIKCQGEPPFEGDPPWHLVRQLADDPPWYLFSKLQYHSAVVISGQYKRFPASDFYFLNMPCLTLYQHAVGVFATKLAMPLVQ